ncbi:DUF6168 family protein [Muricauda sp. TY007]|uniref:DUF6168 family protein n=1 Tax=Allomuricauda sp. TY007 TaxID=2683200 RepID=UPI0034D98776
MKGKGLLQATVFILSFILTYLLHAYLIGCNPFFKNCALFKPYVFLLSFTLLVVIVFLILAQVKKLKDQLGFIYLATLVLKLLLFVVVFQNYFFGDIAETEINKGHFLIPVFLGLGCEVFFLSQLLKRME